MYRYSGVVQYSLNPWGFMPVGIAKVKVADLGVKWWKQRVGVRMLRVELGHPRAALGRPPKLFGDGACGRAGVW